jgi:membrane protein YqaA with SNARE-associated domain
MSFELIFTYYEMMQEILANNTFQDYGLIGLFFNSLLSATAIPLPTEILTSALLIGGENVFLVGIVLIVGSVIGGILNYFIGFGGNRIVEKFKKTKEKKEIIEDGEKHHKLLDKFGWGAIFFASWIPVIGDLILISAGVKKMKLSKFMVFMVSGKILKTVVVVTGLGSIF